MEELSRSVDFCRNVFVPLLGEKYVHPGSVVELPKDFIREANDLVTSANRERPVHRLTKEVAADCMFGVLMPDFCFISDCTQNNFTESTPSPTFCAEIKPKCGILPTCNTHSDQNSIYHRVKQLTCKYCLFQWQKVNKEGKYPRRSEYCPLDLYSNDPGRVLYALKCLLQDPQNNLRIFRDGALVYSGETNQPLSRSIPSIHRGLHANEVSSANNLPSNNKWQLLDFEDMLKSSFIASLDGTVSASGLFSRAEGFTSFSGSSVFLATLLQLLVHDSNIECDMHHQVPNQPTCGESRYQHFSSLEDDDVRSLLSSLPPLTFGTGGILNKILNVQKLDRFGTDEVFKMYKDVCNDVNLESVLHSFKFSKNQTVDNGRGGDVAIKETTFKYFQDPNHSQSVPSPHLVLSNNYQDNCQDETSNYFKLDEITKFLIAASANDCSIMISFQQVDEKPNDCTCYFTEAITGIHYKYSIAAVDLDPKNLHRIPKYYHEYHEIIQNYLRCSKKDEVLY